MLVNCQITVTTMIGAQFGSMIRQKMREEAGAVDACADLDQLGRERDVVVAEEQRREADAVDHVHEASGP